MFRYQTFVLIFVLLIGFSGWGQSTLSAKSVYVSQTTEKTEKKVAQPRIYTPKTQTLERKKRKTYRFTYYDYGYRTRQSALILCIFLGFIGAHRFYTGYWIIGAIYFLTFGLFGVGWLFDLIDIYKNRFRTQQGELLIPKEQAPNEFRDDY